MSEETKDEKQVCYKHPDRETYLRCNKCGKPICQDCAVLTPTGYRCKDCIREQQKVFDTSEPKDYVIGGLIALAIGAAGSWLDLNILISSFLTAVIIGGLCGKLIGIVVRKAVGGRRSGLLKIIVTAAAGIGSLLIRLDMIEFLLAVSFAGGSASILSWGGSLLMQLLFTVVLCITVWMDMSGIVLNR